MERVRGEILRLFGPTGDYGFIRHKGGWIFFHFFQCLPDALARRRWAVGTPIEFEFGTDMHNRPQAVRVSNLDPALVEIDLDSYTEDSVVVGIDAERRRGYLERKNHDQLSFRLGNVITEGELSVGVHVRHKVGIWETEEDGRIGFYAKEIEIYQTPPETEPESEAPGSIEEYFVTAQELPLETPGNSVSPVYSEVERRMTLRELINRKKL